MHLAAAFSWLAVAVVACSSSSSSSPGDTCADGGHCVSGDSGGGGADGAGGLDATKSADTGGTSSGSGSGSGSSSGTSSGSGSTSGSSSGSSSGGTGSPWYCSVGPQTCECYDTAASGFTLPSCTGTYPCCISYDNDGIDDGCDCYTAEYLTVANETCASSLAAIDAQNPGATIVATCPPP